jgi:hypothetical protein
MQYFDGAFFAGTVLALGAILVAYLALTCSSLPVVGNGRAALIAIALIGFVSCSIGGISQAMELGWTNPAMILGSVVGLVAMAIVAAGFLGWDGVLRPVARFAPESSVVGASTERLAIGAVAAIIALKWALDLALASLRSLPAAG